MIALRWTGVTRNRSTIERSRSSMIDIPLQPHENRAVITSTPGTR